MINFSAFDEPNRDRPNIMWILSVKMVIRFFKKIVVLIEQRKKEIKFKKRKNLLTFTVCQSNWMALHMHLTRKKQPYVIQNKCYWALSDL